MTSRQHARSKKGKAPSAPRTFSVATGLTGSTPEELAERAEITAAALAAAERTDARAATLARFVRQMRPVQADGSSGAPRSSASTLSAPSTQGSATGPSPDPIGAVPGAGGDEGSEPEGPRTRSSGLARPAANHPDRTGPSERGASADRPPRVFALSERAGSDSAAVIGLADGVTIAEALRAEESEPDRPGPTAGRSRSSRTLRGAGRRIPPVSATSTSHSASTSATPATSSSEKAASPLRRGLPLVGRKDPAATGPDGAPGGKASRPKPGPGRVRGGKAPSDKKRAESKRSRKKREKKKTPATPLERRRRIPVALAGVFAIAVLATNFPLSSILNQHSQLSAASAQLTQVQKQNKALTEQQNALQSNVAINELARGDYQMVRPGQTLYDVLPPSNNTSTTAPGAPTNGDPGSQPLVAPNDAPDLSPQQVLPTPIPASAADDSTVVSGRSAAKADASGSPTTTSVPTSYWGRVTDTLEFWR